MVRERERPNRLSKLNQKKVKKEGKKKQIIIDWILNYSSSYSFSLCLSFGEKNSNHKTKFSLSSYTRYRIR